MSDRHSGFIVTLASDLKDEDAEVIRSAVLALKHVISVEPVIADFHDHINRIQIRQEMGQKLWDVLYPKDKNGQP
jgi:hypothetical protein